MTRPQPIPVPVAARPAWAADLAVRFWRLLALKTVGISAFMWLFFIGYFELLRNPAYPVTQMPLTPLDALVPFQPGWLPVYLSLWFYVGIAPGLLLTVRELVIYGLWAAAMCLVGMSFFHFLPTAVPPLGIDVSGEPGFALLQGVDATGNACPSMHVAASMFSAVWIDRLLRNIAAPQASRAANVAWLVAISYSTVAIRQHVVLDVAAGALLGLAFALVSCRTARSVAGPRSAG